MKSSKIIGSVRLREDTYGSIRSHIHERWMKTGEIVTFGGLVQEAWDAYLASSSGITSPRPHVTNDDVFLILARNLQDAEIALGKAQAIIRAAQGDDARKEVGAGDASAAETATQQAAASLDKAVGELKGSFGSATLTRRKRIK